MLLAKLNEDYIVFAILPVKISIKPFSDYYAMHNNYNRKKFGIRIKSTFCFGRHSVFSRSICQIYFILKLYYFIPGKLKKAIFILNE
jgi:hypothetical protein